MRASAGVSALVRTFMRRIWSAHSMIDAELPDSLRLQHRDRSLSTWPVPPSMVMMSPLRSFCPSPAVPVRCRRAASRRRTRRACPSARHHRGMAGHAAARRQDALGGMHASGCLPGSPRPARGSPCGRPTYFLGLVGGKHDFARRRARRGRQVMPRRCARPCRWSDAELVERLRLDPSHRLLAADQPFARHFRGDPQRGLCGALSGPRLQHPQRAALDGEPRSCMSR